MELLLRVVYYMSKRLSDETQGIGSNPYKYGRIEKEQPPQQKGSITPNASKAYTKPTIVERTTHTTPETGKTVSFSDERTEYSYISGEENSPIFNKDGTPIPLAKINLNNKPKKSALKQSKTPAHQGDPAIQAITDLNTSSIIDSYEQMTEILAQPVLSNVSFTWQTAKAQDSMVEHPLHSYIKRKQLDMKTTTKLISDYPDMVVTVALLASKIPILQDKASNAVDDITAFLKESAQESNTQNTQHNIIEAIIYSTYEDSFLEKICSTNSLDPNTTSLLSNKNNSLNLIRAIKAGDVKRVKEIMNSHNKPQDIKEHLKIATLLNAPEELFKILINNSKVDLNDYDLYDFIMSTAIAQNNPQMFIETANKSNQNPHTWLSYALSHCSTEVSIEILNGINLDKIIPNDDLQGITEIMVANPNKIELINDILRSRIEGNSQDASKAQNNPDIAQADISQSAVTTDTAPATVTSDTAPVVKSDTAPATVTSDTAPVVKSDSTPTAKQKPKNTNALPLEELIIAIKGRYLIKEISSIKEGTTKNPTETPESKTKENLEENLEESIKLKEKLKKAGVYAVNYITPENNSPLKEAIRSSRPGDISLVKAFFDGEVRVQLIAERNSSTATPQETINKEPKAATHTQYIHFSTRHANKYMNKMPDYRSTLKDITNSMQKMDAGEIKVFNYSIGKLFIENHDKIFFVREPNSRRGKSSRGTAKRADKKASTPITEEERVNAAITTIIQESESHTAEYLQVQFDELNVLIGDSVLDRGKLQPSMDALQECIMSKGSSATQTQEGIDTKPEPATKDQHTHVTSDFDSRTISMTDKPALSMHGTSTETLGVLQGTDTELDKNDTGAGFSPL